MKTRLLALFGLVFALTSCGTTETITCADLTCDTNAACDEAAEIAACVCNAGFTGDGLACSDIDECSAGTDTCSADAACTNTDGSFTCVCNAGFLGDGTTCTDIDECGDESDNCDANATCTNIPGSFTCACNTGYMGDGVTCTDVDECATDPTPCDVNAICTNSVGSFTCACVDGFFGDGFLCTDVDECAADPAPCDPNATCTNEPGTFTCACNMGFTGDGFTCADESCPTSFGTDVAGYTGCTGTWAATPPCDTLVGVVGALTACSSDDCITAGAPIGFTFNYFGVDHTTIDIVSNGKIGFAATSAYTNSCTQEINTIDVYWDDLYPPSGGGAVRYMTSGVAPNRKFTVQWNIPHISGGTDLYDFRAVLYEGSNDIAICYVDTTTGGTGLSNGASATTGIKGALATDQLQFSCNAATVIAPLLVRYNAP